MNFITYKPLFSITATYEIAGLGVLSEGIEVTGTTVSNRWMLHNRMRPKYDGNAVLVFYEGIEYSTNPSISVPVVEVSSLHYIYFKLRLSNKERLQKLQVHADSTAAKIIGYPVLFDAAIKQNNGTPTVTRRDDVEVVSTSFSFIVEANAAALNTNYASLEVKDEDKKLVPTQILPAPLNDNIYNSPQPVAGYAFTIDPLKFEPGIYELKAGKLKKKIFITGDINTNDAIGVVRVHKNNFLKYNTNLPDKSHAEFKLQINAIS